MEKAQEMPLHFAATSRDSTVLKENDFGSLSLIEITELFFFPVCENNRTTTLLGMLAVLLPELLWHTCTHCESCSVLLLLGARLVSSYECSCVK